MSDEIETVESTNEPIEVSAPETAPKATSKDNEKVPIGPFGKSEVKAESDFKTTGQNITQKPKAKEEALPVIPAAYVPNYKFKVLDQEKEMDEWIRPFVKTKDEEEKFRDLLTKAHGLVKIKTERDQLKGEYDKFKNTVGKDYEPVVQQYKFLDQIASECRQTNDWGKFFQAAKFPVQGVIRWAANVVTQLERDPNYLQREESSWQQTQKFHSLESEHMSLKQQAQKLQLERQEMDLDYTLRAPDNSPFSQMFDEQVGTPGALRAEVIRRGAMIEMTEGRVASAAELLGEIRKMYGPLMQAKAEAQAAPTQVIEEADSKPVLPIIKGKSPTPVRKVFKSTDDIRAAYKAAKAG